MTVDSTIKIFPQYDNSYFGEQPLNRVSFLREDKEFLEIALTHGKTQFIPFFKGEPLINTSTGQLYRVSKNQQGPLSSIYKLIQETIHSDGSDLVKRNNSNKSMLHLVFLGLTIQTDDDNTEDKFIYKEQYSGTPVFAINFINKEFDTASQQQHDHNNNNNNNNNIITCTFQNVFNVLTENNEASLYSHSRMYVQWASKFKRCVECGSEIEFVHGGSKWVCSRETCPLANPHQHGNNAAFPRTDPVVITAITNRDWSKICLARSKRSIGKGIIMYSCVAGFMEPAETIESSCQREVWEETGVKVGNNDITIVKSQPWPYPQNLMIGCIATVDFNGENEIIDLNHDPELLDAQWFDTMDLMESFNQYQSGFFLPLALDNKKYNLSSESTVQLPGKNAIAFDLVAHVIKKYQENL